MYTSYEERASSLSPPSYRIETDSTHARIFKIFFCSSWKHGSTAIANERPLKRRHWMCAAVCNMLKNLGAPSSFQPGSLPSLVLAGWLSDLFRPRTCK